MRMVVDSNFLQRPELREYLAQSRQNYTVLTDYAAMEAYKGDTLASIYQSMEILAHYPQQVIVLKGTQMACGLEARDGDMQGQLIDEIQTREFGEYCRHLLAAKGGDLHLQNQILNLGREATAQMDRMLTDAAKMPAVIDELAKVYTEAELKILRTRSPYTEQLLDKVVRNILQLAALLFGNHPQVKSVPDSAALPDTFIFRFALCAYVLLLRWITVGGAKNAKPEKMRNDLVDVNFATFGTYFEGLLTADRKLAEIHQDARFLLHTIFTAKAK